MKIPLIIIFVLITMSTAKAQDGKTSLEGFENLVGGTWKGEDTWNDGTPFKQDITFEWGLSGKMIKVKTYGSVSRKGDKFGLRNEGVRIWSVEASAVKFWEFDIFGGITEGEVEVKGNDQYYYYTYDFGNGPTELTDAWIYKSKDHYEFIVGIYSKEKWQQKYLVTEMKRSNE